MGNIWTYVRTGMITYEMLHRRLSRNILTSMIKSQILYRHTNIGERRGLASRLEDAIVDVLRRDNNETCGMCYVHWGVYESGKTWAARNAAIRLQEEHGKLVIHRDGWDFSHKKTVRDWLQISVGIPGDRGGDKLSTFLPDKSVMIVDHPDFLIEQHGGPGLVVGLRELEIPVLILVNSWERAVELRNSGCQLLGEPGFARWSEDELNGLFKTFSSPLIQDKDSATLVSLMDVGVLSGSPGILFYECHYEERCKPNKRRAKLMDNEWVNGILALNGRDMTIHETTGRFPDKHGIFHCD